MGLALFGSIIVSAFTFFDTPPIYDNPLAYVRSPNTGLSINKTKYKGYPVKYLEGMIGHSMPLVTSTTPNLQLQVGAEAGGWLVLGYDDGAFPMITQDFYFSFPLYFRHKKLSGAFKYNHISSHQGDGMDILIDKFTSKSKRDLVDDIEEAADVDISLVPPLTYSRDYLSGELAYEYMIESVNAKSYIHVGHIHKIVPDKLDRWFVGNGLELRYEQKAIHPYFAQDVRYNQDTDSVDYSAQLGIITMGNALFETRLALTGYIGSDRHGQFLGNKLKQIGIGLFIR
jgi:hypothetical protein